MAQLNYLQEPKNDPNAKSIADALLPKPQPMKASPVRATLPIPQTPAKAPVQPQGFHQVNYTPPMNVPNVSMPDVNVQPLVGQKPNVMPDASVPNLGIKNYLDMRNQGAEQARAVGGRVGELAYSVRNNPVTDAVLSVSDAVGRGAVDMLGGAASGIANFGKGLITGDYTPIGSGNAAEPTIKSAVSEQPAPKATPEKSAATQNASGLTVTPNIDAAYQPQGLPPETGTTAQNTQAKPAATSAGIPKPSKPAKAGKPSANPTIQQQAQPQAQAPVDVGADPFESYKARTGIDLSNTSLAPVPSYVQRVDQTQGMDFQNGQRANANGSAVVPVETQEQFNQRWAMVNDFYNSPEGQALVAARQQGDVVEVQRGDKVSYTDLRNGGEKGIQDFIADQAAKDSALAKSPTSPMNNRELNQLDLLKPKLASETDIAQTSIAANASRDVAGINNADEAAKTALLQEYMNPKTDPKRREQLAPLFAGKEENSYVKVDGGQTIDPDTGRAIKQPDILVNARTGQPVSLNGNTGSASPLIGKKAVDPKTSQPLKEGATGSHKGVNLIVRNGTWVAQ